MEPPRAKSETGKPFGRCGDAPDSTPRQLMKRPGMGGLARCGGCGHSGEEHRDPVSCTVPICSCTGYVSMDRILPHGADAGAVRLPVEAVMVTSPAGFGRDLGCGPTSIVEGELACR